MTDEELIQQLKQGNEAALEALVFRYHAPIRSYIARLVRNPAHADELTQECFERVCRAALNGRLPDRVRPWMYRIATNLCRDLWKKSSYRGELLAEQHKMISYPDRDTVTSILERQWEREEIIRALESLPEDHRKIVILRYYHDLKLEEIAEIMEMPLNTLKSKLYKSLKSLAAVLAGKEERTVAEKK
jgi:RNA polymerase sigma factor, sigma-70 family